MNDDDASVKAGKKHDTRWRPGLSGNPRGRQARSRSVALLALDEVAAGAAPKLLAALIEAGLAGDVQAARLVLDKV